MLLYSKSTISNNIEEIFVFSASHPRNHGDSEESVSTFLNPAVIQMKVVQLGFHLTRMLRLKR